MARRPVTFLLAAGLCAGLFVVLLAFAYLWPQARYLDATALAGFVELEPGGDSLAELLVRLGDPLAVVLGGAVLAGVALLRGRPRVAALVVVLIGATSVSSQLLKALLAYPRYESAPDGPYIAPEAFPSGHSTAAMTISLCLVLVSPRRLRPLAALVGSSLALGVAFSTIALGWHFPSDAVGGFLLASGLTLAGLAGLAALDAHLPARGNRSLATPAVRRAVGRLTAVALVAGAGAVLAGLLAVGVALAARSDDGLLTLAARHTSVAVVAPTVALAAVVLLAGVAALSRRH